MVRNLASVLVLLFTAGGIQADEKSVRKDLEDAGAKLEVNLNALRSRSGYKSVTFDGVRGTDALLKNLCEISCLDKIDLRGSDVTDSGVGIVSELKWLTFVNLEGTRITDSGLRRLENVANLRDIVLADCPNVTAEGIDHFQKALPKCRIIGR